MKHRCLGLCIIFCQVQFVLASSHIQEIWVQDSCSVKMVIFRWSESVRGREGCVTTWVGSRKRELCHCKRNSVQLLLREMDIDLIKVRERLADKEDLSGGWFCIQLVLSFSLLWEQVNSRQNISLKRSNLFSSTTMTDNYSDVLICVHKSS